MTGVVFNMIFYVCFIEESNVIVIVRHAGVSLDCCSGSGSEPRCRGVQLEGLLGEQWNVVILQYMQHMQTKLCQSHFKKRNVQICNANDANIELQVIQRC